MANCKGCNKRIDFDEKDKSVILGETLGSLDNALLKTPVFGKYAYIRRGRHYWHIDCYPDTLKGLFDQDKFEEELSKAIDTLREDSSEDQNEIKVLKENFKIQEEAIKQLVLEKEELKKAASNHHARARIIKEDYDRVGSEKVVVMEKNKTLVEINMDQTEKIQNLEKDLVEFEKLKKQLKDLGINGTPK